MLGVVLVFAVVTAFVYELWPVAASCTILFGTSLWMLSLWAAGRLRFIFSPTLVLLASLPLIGTIQYVTSRTVYPFATLLAVILLSGAACCFWISSEVFQFASILSSFRLFLVVFGVLISLLAILQLLTSEGRIFWFLSTHGIPQPMASFLNRDRYSAFIELLLPLVLFQVLNEAEHWTLYAVGAGCMYASVVAGGSRAGLILTTSEVLVISALSIRQGAFSRSRIRAGVVVVMLSAGLATAIGWEYVMQRFSQSDPFAYRREFLMSSIRMWQERPFLGFGLGSWPSVYPRFAIIDPGKFVNHAHNDWAEWAADGGILFVLIYALIAWRAARRAVRVPEALGVTVVFIHSLVDFNFQNYPLVLLVAVLLAGTEASASRVADESLSFER